MFVKNKNEIRAFVDAIIGNRAFRHDRYNIFSGLSYSEANNTFLNCLRKSDVEAQVEFTLKVMERARVTYKLLMYQLTKTVY